MHKVALITDQHFGCRNDNQTLDNYFRRFYQEVFFPYIDEHQIKTVVALGDTFDRRKFINYNILSSCRNYWFDELSKRNLEVHILVGNHDTFFKSTNDINSPELLLNEYDFNTYYSPQEIKIGQTSIAMIPWICSDNYQETIDLLNNTKADLLFGHLEIAGFEMHKGNVSEHGHDKNLFRKFDLVCSGHFHTKSRDNNILYLGAPYEMTWADYNDPRGFHIIDLDTKEIEYIINPLNIFKKIYYNDKNKTLEELLEIEDVSDVYLKILVQEKTNPYWFDLFLDKVEQMNPIQTQIIEGSIYVSDDEELNLDEVEDTLTILKKYCGQIESNVDKNKLEKMMISLYNSAQEQG